MGAEIPNHPAFQSHTVPNSCRLCRRFTRRVLIISSGLSVNSTSFLYDKVEAPTQISSNKFVPLEQEVDPESRPAQSRHTASVHELISSYMTLPLVRELTIRQFEVNRRRLRGLLFRYL